MGTPLSKCPYCGFEPGSPSSQQGQAQSGSGYNPTQTAATERTDPASDRTRQDQQRREQQMREESSGSRWIAKPTSTPDGNGDIKQYKCPECGNLVRPEQMETIDDESDGSPDVDVEIPDALRFDDRLDDETETETE